MADRSSERDRRVRQLMGNKNPGFDVLGQAQAEIQDAQSELYNHIALQNAQEQSRLQETSTISQAAAGMMAMEEGDQLQVQAATMNPSTQATLGKYGVKPSQTQNSSRNIQTQKVISKSGDTTNIRNENITTNRTDIRVTQPSIPMMQSSPVVVNGGSKKEDSTSKFKAWLSGMFAKQQNEAEIQRKEYRKKEWALGRTTSKLMKKIGEATSNLGNRLDPKNMTSSLGGQIKWLLLLFGATMIGKVWKPAMQFLANLEGGFRAAFGLPMTSDLRNNASGAISVVDQLKIAMGIDPKSEDTNLVQGVGRVFMQGIDKLIDKLEFWFEDRAASMKEVEFPKVEVSAIHPYESIVNAVKGIGQYLGDVITVAFGGSKGKVRVEASKVEKEAQASFTDTKGKQTSVGDSALITGNGRNYMRSSDYDSSGNLKGNAGSTQAMSQSLISMFNDDSGKGHTVEIATGVSQLFKTAKRNGEIAIDPELLTYLGLSQQDLVTLQKSGNLTQKPYRIIAVKPNEAQKNEMGAYDGNWGKTSWTIGGAIGGAALGAALGSELPIIGNIAGGIIGGVIGGFGGGVVGHGVGTGVDQILRDWSTKGYYPVIVPADSKQVSADGSRGINKAMWVLDSRGAEIVKGKISKLSGMGKDEEMDLTSKNFYNFIRKRGETLAHRRGILLKNENIGTSGLERAQAQYSQVQREYDRRFNSNDPESWNQRHYGNFNSAWSSAASTFNSAVNGVQGFASDVLITAGNIFKTVGGSNKRRLNYGHPIIKDRIKYIMGQFINAGMKPSAAAGIVGNLMCENLTATNLAEPYPDGRPGQYSLGIAAFYSSGALPGLKKWCMENGYDWRTLEGQTAYLTSVPAFKKIIAATSNLNDKDSIRVSAQIWGHDFEKFAGYDKLGSSNYQNRIKMGGSAYELVSGLQTSDLTSFVPSSDPSSKVYSGGGNYTGSYEGGYTSDSTNFSYSTTPLINLSGNSSGGNAGGIIWIGDSQTAASGGLWPKLVGQGLGGSFTFFGRASANSNHYLGTLSESKLGAPVTNSRVSTCKSMLDVILSSPPKYVIIALGHNGVSGYSSLVSKLNGSGIDVIGIKMWSINGSRSGMYTYSPEQMQKMYSGISLNKWVDLTGVDIPKTSDGVHASEEGCKIAASETLRQLKGGPAQNSGILYSIGNSLVGAGEAINPNKSADDSNPLLLNKSYTPQQQEAINNFNKYETFSNQVLAGALAKGGAKVDEYGVYLETSKGVNVYLKETANAIGRTLSDDDIAFVARKNSETGRLEDISADEEKIARDSVQFTMASAFSSYKGKGSVGDRMTKDGKYLLIFDLGEFTDIQSYSKIAQEELKGKIHFWVCPTKDGTRIAFIKINKFDSRIYSNQIETKRSLTKQEADSIEYVGPIIYDLGRQWYVPWDDTKTSDWQPTARIHNVYLTPEAEKEKTKLLMYISMGEITQENGKYYAGGKELDDDQVKDLKKYGIITGIRYNVGSGKNSSWWKNEGITEDYRRAIKEAKYVIKSGETFNSNEYFTQLGITSKDREKFFKDNKGSFVYRNGQIIGPGGVVWGTYEDTNGKRKENIFDEKKFSDFNIKLGGEEINKNYLNAKYELENIALSSKGQLNYNAVGDFISKIGGVDLQGKDKDLIPKINARILKQNKGYEYSDTTGNGKIGGSSFKYYIFSDANGDIKYFRVTKDQVKKLAEDIIGSTILDQNFQDINAKTIDELYSKLLRKVSEISVRNKNKSHGKDYIDPKESQKIEKKIEDLKKNSDYEQFNNDTYRGDGRKYRDTIPELQSYLIKKGELIQRIETPGLSGGFVRHQDAPAIVYYFNGEVETLGRSRNFWFPTKNCIKQWWWDRINRKIREIKGAGIREKVIRDWNSKDNNFRANLDTLFDQAIKSGNYYVDHGIMVTRDGGFKVGVSDGKGGFRKIEQKDLDENDEVYNSVVQGQAIDYFNNNQAAKALYYQKYYGARIENGGVWKYSDDGKFRIKINTNIPLENINDNNRKNIFDKNSVQVKKDGKWVDNNKRTVVNFSPSISGMPTTATSGTWLSQNQINEQIQQIVNGLGKINDSVDINNAYTDLISGNTGKQVNQGISAAKQISDQITKAKDQIAVAKRSELYLKEIAEKGGADVKALHAAIDRINNKANSDALVESVQHVGVQGVKGGTQMYVSDSDGVEEGKGFIIENGDLYRVVHDQATGLNRKVKVANATSAEYDGKQIIWYNKENNPVIINITKVETLPESSTTSDGGNNPK